MKRTMFLMTCVVLIALLAPLASASSVRTSAMGGTDWIVADDSDNFINPANSAWAEDAYVTLTSRFNTIKWKENDVTKGSYGYVHFVKPTGTLLGHDNVLGGWVNGALEQRNNDVAAFPYEWESKSVEIYLQDAVKLSDNLAVAGAFGYSPNPRSWKYTYDDGQVSDYRDDGSGTSLEASATYIPSEQMRLELDVMRNSTDDTQDRYVDDAFWASYPYEMTSTAISGKVGYTLNERTVVSGLIRNTSWDKDDDGDKSDGSDMTLALGATYQADDQLLVAGSVENAKSTVSGTSDSAVNFRAGAEYTLSDSIKLRGGFIHLGGKTTETDFTAGAGLAVGPGTLDLYAMFGSTSSDVKYSQIHAAYTFNF